MASSSEKRLKVGLAYVATVKVGKTTLPLDKMQKGEPILRIKSDHDREVNKMTFLARRGRSVPGKILQKKSRNGKAFVFDPNRIEIINKIKEVELEKVKLPKKNSEKIVQAILEMKDSFSVYDLARFMLAKKKNLPPGEEDQIKDEEITRSSLTVIYKDLKEILPVLSSKSFSYLSKVDKKGKKIDSSVRSIFYLKNPVLSKDLRDRNIKGYNQLLEIANSLRSGQELSGFGDLNGSREEDDVAQEIEETSKTITGISISTAHLIAKMLKEQPEIERVILEITRTESKIEKKLTLIL